MPDLLNVVLGGVGKKRIKDASKVLAKATERIELSLIEIRKATVGRVLGRKIRSSVLEIKFKVSVRPPSGGIIESAGGWVYESVFGIRGLHLEVINVISTKM